MISQHQLDQGIAHTQINQTISILLFESYCPLQIYLPNSLIMPRNYALHSASNTIDVLLNKGASTLYDKYLNQKLPSYSHTQNQSIFQQNLNMHSVTHSIPQKIEIVQSNNVKAVPIDTNAPKRIFVAKNCDKYSTLSPKNTNFGKSTNYQTLLPSNKSNGGGKYPNAEITNDSIFLQDNLRTIVTQRKKERPLTMQTARVKRIQDHKLQLDSKIQELQERRAMTCHTRKRKIFTNNEVKKAKFIKIRDDLPCYAQEELQAANHLRLERQIRQQCEMEKERQRMSIQRYIKMKQKKTQQNFQEAKEHLKAKSNQIPITNLQIIDGQIFINGKPKVPKTHIIQLEFNPEEESTLKNLQVKVSGVNSKKKFSFVTKLKKKNKISTEQFTNNGDRQISSIPFITLSHGIILSESTLQATASRRRPAGQISRMQFTLQNSPNRFKSHIPIVNEVKLNMLASLDEHSPETARSSFIQSNVHEKKDFETTHQSKRQMEKSLLWKARDKSQTKKIRISNREAFNQEILDLKLYG